MKKCIYCGKAIQDEAIKCEYCGGKNDLKNIGCLMIILLFILIPPFLYSLLDNNNNNASNTEQHSETKVQQKILFPVKELINKTPSEIEKITGQKLEIYGEKPSGKLMGAGFTLNGIDVYTDYTLIKNPKVKYNGTLLFQIFFDNPLSENKAWRTVDFIPPDKSKGVKNRAFGISDERVTWKNISEIEPFSQVSIWYINNKVNALKFYLLSEEEATPLYQTPL